jgi:hypothetical protein
MTELDTQTETFWRNTLRRQRSSTPVKPLDMRKAKNSHGWIAKTGSVPVAARWQITHDDWRNADRSLRWWGRCPVCNRNVWAFDDGENDPRGVLGDNALWPSTFEDRHGRETEIATCAVCANDEPSYRVAERMAIQQMRPKDRPGATP